MSYSTVRRRHIEKIPVTTLFDWTDGLLPLTKLLHGLKGCENSLVYLQSAARLSAQLPEAIRRPDWVVVPAPPSRKNSQDHAYGFASTVAKILNLPLRTCLERGSRQVQKRAGQKERTKVKIRKKTGFTCEVYKGVLFVDDIVTTGATMLAAYKALRRPQYQVLAIAYRPMLQRPNSSAIVRP